MPERRSANLKHRHDVTDIDDLPASISASAAAVAAANAAAVAAQNTANTAITEVATAQTTADAAALAAAAAQASADAAQADAATAEAAAVAAQATADAALALGGGGGVTPAALTKADDTNVTLTLGGTPATAVLQATSLTLGWTGILAVARGGSGAATLTGHVKGNGTGAFTASATIPWADLSSVPTTLGGYGITDAQGLDATLTALAGLNSTAGLLVETAADTFTKRTLHGTTARIDCSNGDGVSGDPTFDISASYVGQSSITTLGTITTGTWHGVAIDVGSYLSGTLLAAQFPALTGDVTTTAGSLATAIGANKVTTTTIAANAVTLAKLATQADQTILGNTSGGTAVPSALTASQIRTILGLATVATSGSASDLGSGTLPTGRMPALTGDVTSTVNTVGTTIANDAVTYAKMQNVSATSRVLGRITAGAGDPEELTAANLSTILGLATVATSGSATDLGSGTLPAGRMPAHTGDVTTSAGAVATAIANSAVTYAKMQNVAATLRVLGRITAGSGVVEELTAANIKTILALATTDLSDITSGTFTATLTGCTTSPTVTVNWNRIGNVVTLDIPLITGTSNTTACTLTGLPAGLAPARAQRCMAMIENAAVFEAGSIAISAGTQILTVVRVTNAAFTNTGTKGIANITITYNVA